jgi:hypothetical protein
MHIASLNDQAHLRHQQRLEDAAEARRRKHAVQYAREQKAAARAMAQGSRTTTDSIAAKLTPVAHSNAIVPEK